MKKLILLIACWGMLYGSTYAQSLSTSNTTPIIYGDTSGATMTASIDVTNVSNIALNVKVKRIIIDSVIGSDEAMAWDNSYPPGFEETAGALLIDTGQTITAFQALYFNNGNPGICRIQYCFFDESNPSDSVCEVITFDASITDIPSNEFAHNGDVRIYPNPTKHGVTIELTRTFVVVRQVRLLDVTGSYLINTSQNYVDMRVLKPGVYLCEVEMLDGTVVSKRLIKQ